MDKRKGGILLFLMWQGFGFLMGLTGSVIAAPRYFPAVDYSAPLVYNAGLKPASQSSTGATSQPASTGEREGEIFVTRGCIQCHRITAYDLKGGVTGPDLSIAYHDVPDRFGKTLEEFLWEPEGTMGEIIPGRGVTDEEKKKILELLTKAARPEAEKEKEKTPPAKPEAGKEEGKTPPATGSKGEQAPGTGKPTGGGDEPAKK